MAILTEFISFLGIQLPRSICTCRRQSMCLAWVVRCLRVFSSRSGAVARGLKASIPTRCVLPRHTDFDPIPKVRTRARGFLKRYGARLLLLSCSRIYPWGRRSHAVGAEHSTSRIAVTSQSSKRLRCRIVGYADTRKRLPRRELAQSWIGRPWVLRGSLPAEKVGTGSLHASWLNQQT